ncbi:hypothetical protein ACFQZ4_06785 [Catellatospora coxensis]
MSAPKPAPRRRGAPLPAQRRPDRAAEPEPAGLYAVNAAAAAFYAAHLPTSRPAAAYLRSRGIAEAAEPGGGWQLGVAPAHGDALLRHLRELGYSHRVMLDAGLVAASRLHGGALYDVFRDRLVFPIHARDGRIAGFTGRDLSGRSKAKFYNTPKRRSSARASCSTGSPRSCASRARPPSSSSSKGPPTRSPPTWPTAGSPGKA